MGPCGNLSEVRAFLGTIGVVRIFIRDFALRANPLIKLTCKDAPFKFGSDQIKAQEDLQTALIESPTLRAINYMSLSPSYLQSTHSILQSDSTFANVTTSILENVTTIDSARLRLTIENHAIPSPSLKYTDSIVPFACFIFTSSAYGTWSLKSTQDTSKECSLIRTYPPVQVSINGSLRFSLFISNSSTSPECTT